MTKAELIEEVSRVVEMTRKDSEVIVEAIFDSVVRSLRTGDKIEIRGFGSFRTRQRQPRVGRNPKTGTRVEVPSKRIPYFKPSKELKDLVNHSSDQPAAAAGPMVRRRTCGQFHLFRITRSCRGYGSPLESWRYTYIRKATPEDECIFCAKLAENHDPENYIIYRGRLNFVLLNLYPYTNGHLMIAPYQHVATLEGPIRRHSRK